MKWIILLTLVSFTLLMIKETRIVIPIDSEFKSTLYNASSPDVSIITSYSTSLPMNTFIYRFNDTTQLDNSSIPSNKEGNFSFIYNSNATTVKPFSLRYNTIHQYNEANNSIEASLALNNDLNSNNFITQLYTQSILQSTQFSFYYNDAVNNSQLFLGDFSTGTNISTIFNSLAYCQTHTSNWECQITSMKIKSLQYKIYSNMIIDTSSSIVSIPISDYKILRKYYLGEDCFIDKDNDNQIKCKCSSQAIYNDNIQLTLENRESFSLNLKYLIDYYPNDVYQCHWKLYVNEDDLTNWVIGRPGLVNSFYSFDLKTKRFGFIQDINHINSLVTNEIVIDEDRGSNYTSKLGWVLTLIIVFLIMWGVYQYAITGNILNGFRKKRNSLDANDNEDRKNILNISEMFKKEEDNKEFKDKTQGEKIEMKELLIEKNN